MRGGTGCIASIVSVVVPSLGLASVARAQFPCPDPAWQPGHGVTGLNGPAYAIAAWDADGPSGSQASQFVIGGSFTLAGQAAASNIALYDPAMGSWSAMGAGSPQPVYALTVSSDGVLTAARGPSLMRWNGSSWTTHNYFFTKIGSLTSLANGDVIAGGHSFSNSNIARWDGTHWFPLGSGMKGSDDAEVLALATLPSGDVVAGGHFTMVNGVPGIHRVARWDGSSWNAMGTGMNWYVRALLAMPNGDVLAGGDFTTAGGVACDFIARWDGSAWSPVDGGFNEGVHALARDATTGDVLAGGAFTIASGGPAHRIARWNGSAWLPIGEGFSDQKVLAIASMPMGSMLAGGSFLNTGTTQANRVASWSGTAWSAMGTENGLDGFAYALTMATNRERIVGGEFTRAGETAASNIARWDGRTWSAVGAGIDGRVESLRTLADGDVIAGGSFGRAGEVDASNIARWDGATWLALGDGLTSTGGGSPSPIVRAVTETANGDVIAGGLFTHAGVLPVANIARWDGSAWWALASGTNGEVLAIEGLANGDVVAGGAFTFASGLQAKRIARWNGEAWSSVGSGLNSDVHAVLLTANGDLIAASGTVIARWNGTNWTTIGQAAGPGGVYALLKLGNNDLIAGGFFPSINGVTASGVARWDGSAWSPLGLGVGGAWVFPNPPQVESMVVGRDGELFVAGRFSTAGPYVSNHVARYGCSTAPPACEADCDGDGMLAIDDFICFQTLFALGEQAADCDDDGSLAIDDFICFQTLFAIGC